MRMTCIGSEVHLCSTSMIDGFYVFQAGWMAKVFWSGLLLSEVEVVSDSSGLKVGQAGYAVQQRGESDYYFPKQIESVQGHGKC